MTDPHLAQLHDDVRAAATVVAPSWPLSSVIAVNPLAGFEDQPFDAALARAGELFGGRGRLALAELRALHASGRIPDPDLLAALRRAVPELDDVPPIHIAGRPVSAAAVLLADLVHGIDDPAPSRTAVTIAEAIDARTGTDLAARVDLEAAEHCLAAACDRAEGHPRRPPATGALLGELDAALESLGVALDDRRRYLEAHVAALPGWAAHLRWRDAHDGGDSLLELLTVRVTAEARLVAERGIAHHGPPATVLVGSPAPIGEVDAAAGRVTAVAEQLGAGPEHTDALAAVLSRLAVERRAAVWVDAYERSLQDPLLAAIARADHAAEADDGPPLVAEVVTCIDVRSEGLRRHLEARSGYRTYGYAGFFGLPVRLRPLAGGEGADQCPVLLTPTAELAEVAALGAEGAAARTVARAQIVVGADAAWRAAKHHPIAPLGLSEGAGWLSGPTAAARTAAPHATSRLIDRFVAPKPAGPTCFDRTHLTLAEQADWVASIWALGMADDTAPLVVLCGHGSRADNNPMESGLACGACGGHRGGPNARLAAAMANDPAVRAELADRGVPIASSVWFVAAEHDTATDQVTLLDLDDAPASHCGVLARLRADLEAAGTAAALERATTLPGAGALPADDRRRLRLVRRRGRDWAEPVAELGLAGNHAFVVGPRSLTAHLDLGRRVFLHSYEPGLDPTGARLRGILTAPLIVAQWINAQYNLSTTDPEVFGAGSKAVHNVVADIGVLSGPSGDLRRGLPLQSVRAGDRLLHEPVRLLAVVQGRLDHIDAALAGSDGLRRLVEHEWISLVARPGPGEPWQQRARAGWEPRLLGCDEREEVASWAVAV